MDKYITFEYSLFTNMMTFVAALLFIILSSEIKEKTHLPQISFSKEVSTLNFNETFYQVFNLGQKRMISSFLWIVTLLESDVDHYQGHDLKSWLFLRFKTIINLNDNFREVYVVGGQYLSVIKNDIKGAKYIFERGLEKFPQDYEINLFAGYHYYFELGEINKAVECFQKIKNDPRAPVYLDSIISKLMAEGGDLETSYNLLSAAYQNLQKNRKLKERYFENLNSVRIEMDLKCLNSRGSAKLSCQQQDLKQVNYVKARDGRYVYPQKWRPFRIFRNKSAVTH